MSPPPSGLHTPPPVPFSPSHQQPKHPPPSSPLTPALFFYKWQQPTASAVGRGGLSWGVKLCGLGLACWTTTMNSLICQVLFLSISWRLSLVHLTKKAFLPAATHARSAASSGLGSLVFNARNVPAFVRGLLMAASQSAERNILFVLEHLMTLTLAKTRIVTV